MTRFARAKGSKASNEKLPEEATSWTEMKQQMEQKKVQEVDEIKRQGADKARMENYKKFLEEEENRKDIVWSEFAECTVQKKRAAQNNKVENVSTKIDQIQKRKRSHSGETNPVTVGGNEGSIDQKDLPVMPNKVQKKKLKNRPAKNKKENVAVVPKKLPEHMTESELKIFNKKKEKRLKQLEKRKEFKEKNKSVVNQESNEQQAGRNEGKKLAEKSSKEHKRRKPNPEPQAVNINGKSIELVYFDGFPIKKEDAERLQVLRKQMISKGLPRSEVKKAMKLERRRAEKSLSRDKKSVCFNCRISGHVLSECPNLNKFNDIDSVASGICFKCGSTEHTHFECKIVKNQEFRFATCFICKEQGHIARQCPDNARGLYPQGGGCKLCGDVTHLKKDCPQHMAKQEAENFSLDTIRNDELEALENHSYSKPTIVPRKINKIIKF